ncbi:MAG: hypothetical protein WCC94_10850 [Candidatus Bathyarchaeia archaeon]
MTEKGFDEYFGKIMPLAVAISLMKTFLAEDIAKQVIAHVEKSDRRTITKDEVRIIQRAADAALARLNPDAFKVDVNWSPKSADEMRKKLVELKFDQDFKQSLVEAVLHVFREPQARLDRA